MLFKVELDLQIYSHQKKNSFDHIRTFICDKVTAYTVSQAATAALLARATTNEGQHIDISMLHACLAFMWPDGMMHRTLKDDDKFEMSPGSDYFQTINYKDGGVAVAPLSWIVTGKRYCQWLDTQNYSELPCMRQ